ncbi:MAG: hydrogenase maturation protease [Deferribacteres bacterium]|nr:hydrogenase maturation protease [candidate division KSB1 bacterium]MCB9502075.1 hydrogenase maturation protease [Deferribacteres bacterium]
MAIASASRLVIGIGNNFRNDDQVGLNLARRIEQKHIPDVEIVAESKEILSLIERWNERKCVYVCDAVKSGSPVGTIFRFDILSGNLKNSLSHFSSHSFGISEVVALAKQLNQLPQKLLFYGIEGANYDYGNELTPKVKNAEDVVFAELYKLLLDETEV